MKHRHDGAMGARAPYRELTVSGILSAILAGALLNAGIVYAGLQIGFTIVGSAVAAVLGFGLLRGIFRRFAPESGSILEVNIFQTVASSVNTVNAGIIFTVPVLYLLGLEQEIHFPALLLAAVAGSLLGVVMIIPLRKQIIEFERLRFPEGTATASILKSPGAGIQKSVMLVLGLAFSGIVVALTKRWSNSPKMEMVDGERVAATIQGVIPESFHFEALLGLPPGIACTLVLSLLSLGAGFLAGRPGLVVLYGTLLNYWFLVPIAILLGWVPDGFDRLWQQTAEISAAEGPEAGYALGELFLSKFSHFTSRHVGIGMILGGAMAGILVAMPALKAAIGSLRSAGKGGRKEEVSFGVIRTGTAVGLILVLVAAKLSGGEGVGWGTALMVTVFGGAWLWLAGLVVAQTTGRTDWSPLSGLALIAIAIFMGIMGREPHFIVPAVTLGAAVCVATSMCADMMADLKTGYLVGALPIKQQIAQIATCWVGPGISLAVVILLWKAYAFGPDQAGVLFERRVEAAGLSESWDRVQQQGAESTAFFLELHPDLGDPQVLPPEIPELQAPQAGALQAAIQIVQSGDVPLGKYLAGAFLALFLSLLVSPGLGVMIGLSMYLPFEYMAVFGIGGLINIFLTRRKGARFVENWGVPLAAGLIVGDALVGVAHAVFKVSTSFGGS